MVATLADNTTWKTHLLSSGMPLEYSVIDTLIRLGSWHPREYRYQRPNELGVPTVFSVDVHASQILKACWLELLIECKYRRDGIKWVFMPERFSDLPGGSDFDAAFLILDGISGYHLDRGVLRSASKHYIACGKGIEIHEKGNNPKAIEQAVCQLSFAVPHRVVECIEEQLGWMEDFGMYHVLVPIIVTTAELWRMKEHTTIEEVREAAQLDAIATREDMLFMCRPPDTALATYTKSLLQERLGRRPELVSKIEERTHLSDFETYAATFGSRYPSVFVIMSHDRFESAMRDLTGFFAMHQARTEGS